MKKNDYQVFAERNESIRSSVAILASKIGKEGDSVAGLVIRSSRNIDRDGMNRQGEGSSRSKDILRLTGVEAAASSDDQTSDQRDQALAVLQMQKLAMQLLERAADYAQRLTYRQGTIERSSVDVTCVEIDCEKLRGEGWDETHPNGIAGRCAACYQKRRRLRING